MEQISFSPENIRCASHMLSFLSPDRTLEELVTELVREINSRMALNALAIIRLDEQGGMAEKVCRSLNPVLSEATLCRMLTPETTDTLLAPFRKNAGAENDVLLPPDLAVFFENPLVLPIRKEEMIIGLTLWDFPRVSGDGPQQNSSLIHLLTAFLGVLFTVQRYCETQSFQSRVLNAAMDQVKACVYITDPATDAILYMNQSMKETFHLREPEGKTCWKVLQTDQHERCSFCPLPQLLKTPEKSTVYRWEEQNSATGRFYENYDSLMPWLDGSVAHLQYSVDITDSRRLYHEAMTDELTGLMNRRAGKAALAAVLEKLPDDDARMTVCLLDVNFLKKIKDTWGYQEGDRLLTLVAGEIRESTHAPDFSFRLSEEAFVIVCHNRNRHGCTRHLEQILQNLKRKKELLNLPYQPGFCFGCFEVLPEQGFSLEEVLSKADEAMYDQKKQFHIREAGLRLQEGSQQTQQTQTSEFQYEAALLFDALVKSTDAYIYVTDMKSGAFRYSPAMVHEFGLPGEVVENAAAVWGEKVHPADKAAFLEANQIIADGRADSHCVEYRVKNIRDEWVWVRCRGYLQRDEKKKTSLFAGFITNLGQNNTIDHLTGLPNKIKLAEDFEPLVQQHPGSSAQLMLLGLDSFKHINDLYNRLVGDQILRVIAQKIQSMLPANATMYRLDGDEFGILLRGDQQEAGTLYRSIAGSFRQQQAYAEKKYFCTLSAGCAEYPKDAVQYAELLQHASGALKHSKKNGKNQITFFHPRLIVYQKRSLELIELLRESIEQDFAGFEVVYQPQFSASTQQLVGAEALARWTCAQYGVVSPAEFVPLLEESGLIVPFGKWVFREAVNQCKKWTRICPDFVMSVNLSYPQVTTENFVLFIQNTLNKVKLSPRNLVVEFTESCMIQENDQLHAIFDAIRKQGIQIAMDDFGTGYSSLGMLKNSPADVVKIDRVFVRDILKSKFDATLIRFVVELCHAIGIKVCLEGVEREEELRLVRTMSLDFIQGYLFGRPAEAQAFEERFLKVDTIPVSALS